MRDVVEPALAARVFDGVVEERRDRFLLAATVSGTVHDLVAGSGIEFQDRGMRVLPGVPGEWRIYAAL